MIKYHEYFNFIECYLHSLYKILYGLISSVVPFTTQYYCSQEQFLIALGLTLTINTVLNFLPFTIEFPI